MLDQLYEIHDALRPTFANTSSQRTVVLPSASPAPPSAHEPTVPPISKTAETQVIGGRPAVPVRPSSAVALAGRPDTTNRRKVWFIALAVVIALVAGGTGWYFLFGPGSLVSVPDVAGLSRDDAAALLQEQGFTVDTTDGQTDSPTVTSGLVAETDPPIGQGVSKGQVIQLLISTGPKPIPVPAFGGMTEDEARQAIEAAPFKLLDPVLYQFSAEVSEGIVVDVLGTDGTSIIGAPSYGEDQGVTLIISAGALPDVAGKAVNDAKQILAGVGLEVASDVQEEFHNDIPAGNVIGIDTGDGPVRQGDTVTLVVSRGPDLVTVPAGLVGMSIADAKAAVEAAGLVADIQTNIPEIFWGLPGSEVDAVTPASGEQALRGSTVVIEAFA
jgi:serine/threonine-protein kinase